MLARKLRTNQTDAERLLWSRLRDTSIPGYKFRRQFPIKPYFADFCCVQSRLVIELDGGQHARNEEKDQKRTQYLEKRGYRVIRFWDNDVLLKTDTVVEAIYNELQLPSLVPPTGLRPFGPHPSPAFAASAAHPSPTVVGEGGGSRGGGGLK